jgi:Na+/H+ antiporter NhaD/arsenite permease-like protein
VEVGVTTAVFIAVFGGIYFEAVDRRVAVLLGAMTILGYGLMSGFFSIEMAIESVYFETLTLIFGMSAISAVLARSGLFSLIATRTANQAVGNTWWVLLVFVLITYGLSLIVNNLAAMVVILPVTLSVCRQMWINPVPLLIAEIIASNLGGASTMVGDFPNMIISSAGNLHFLDFISGMMVPCLVLLAAMLMFFQWRRQELHSGMEGHASSGTGRGSRLSEPEVDPHLMRVGLFVLGVALVGFLVSDFIGLRPGWVAVICGVVVLLVAFADGKKQPMEIDWVQETTSGKPNAKSDWNEKDWLVACGGQDILFFSCLFIMVGGLVAAGALDGVVWLIDTISDGQDVPMMLALMWVAAFLTIFLNAGATTAFFVPVASGMEASISDATVWWALSLGVLAGSSAALTGATAGPLAATHLDRFIKVNPGMQELIPSGGRLDFKGYLYWGLPVMGIFLVLSSFYIIAVAR